MDTRQRDSLEALRRFQQGLDQYNDLLGNLNETRPRKELDELIAGLSSLAVEHEQLRIRKEGETRRIKALRQMLLEDHLLSIIRIKELNDRDLSVMATAALPPAGASDLTLVDTARALALTAAQHGGVFVRDGLPADFAEQCIAAIEEFVVARVDRNATRLHWQGVTRVIDTNLTRAWLVVAALKALARKTLRRHPHIAAELRQALLHRPRTALSAAPRHPALPAGASEPASEPASSSTALVPVAPPLPAAAPPAPRRRISVLARVAEFFRPAA